MNRTVVLVLVAVAVVAGTGIAIKLAVDGRRPKGSDTVQIQMMLLEGEKAAERRDSAGIGRFISPNYSDNLGLRDATVRYQIRDFLRRYRTVDVNIPTESIQITLDPDGKSGSASFRAMVSAQGDGGSQSSEVEMTIKVAKERVYYFWIFPGEEWKVTAADGYQGLE